MRRLLGVGMGILSFLAAACSSDGDGSGAADSGGASGAAGSAGTGGTSSSGGGSGGVGGNGAAGGTVSSGGGTGGQSAAALQGFWVWEQKVENGAVTFTVTDDDMLSKVGPSGWPGCPDGILCTKYGIQKLAFGPAGQFWNMTNVTTGSDSNLIGTYSVTGSVVAIAKEHEYSCAHPEQNSPSTGTGYYAWKLEGDRLWVSQPLADSEPSSPTSWLVLKPVTETEFYGKYMVRICQDYGKEPKCNPGCLTNNYGKP